MLCTVNASKATVITMEFAEYIDNCKALTIQIYTTDLEHNWVQITCHTKQIK